MWKIEKIVKKGEYNYAIVREHPNATKHGYVLHHRVVMENFLGRLLNYSEIVHHKDGNKKNNEIQNLEVMTASDHARHHSLEKGRTIYGYDCPNCDKFFWSRNRPEHKNAKRSFCSRKCAGTFYAEVRSGKRTHEMDGAISVEPVLTMKVSGNTEET